MCGIWCCVLVCEVAGIGSPNVRGGKPDINRRQSAKVLRCTEAMALHEVRGLLWLHGDAEVVGAQLSSAWAPMQTSPSQSPGRTWERA